MTPPPAPLSGSNGEPWWIAAIEALIVINLVLARSRISRSPSGR